MRYNLAQRAPLVFVTLILFIINESACTVNIFNGNIYTFLLYSKYLIYLTNIVINLNLD